LFLEVVQDTFGRYFHQSTCDKVVSADKMMVHARGPVWHRKQQKQGIIPKGLRGLDTEGTWSYSKSDGWVYGHGTFCLVACKYRMLGAFKWMRNSGNEAKRMWLETGKLKGLITTVLMDSKADDKDLFFELQRQRGMLLLTTSRKGADKSPARQRMVQVLKQRKNQRLYKQRSYTVEPMQGVIKDIFELERCWMRGNENNRWVFAAMGVAVQMHQDRAWREGRSPWAIKSEVLGR
jgi:DDE family transposase